MRELRKVVVESDHTPQGDVGYHPMKRKCSRMETRSHPARGRRIRLRLAPLCARRQALHPARGHRRPPRFTAQFCAAKRGGCFFVKFWAVPDFFRNFSNCGSFHSFYIRIQTVSHWKFPQKSGRNFSVSGVFLCRIPCYNGNKPFQTCFSHIPLLFCPKEMIP